VSGQVRAPAALELPVPRVGLDDVENILDRTGTRTPIPRSSSPLPVAIPTPLVIHAEWKYKQYNSSCGRDGEVV
jgi:hypothetical protein